MRDCSLMNIFAAKLDLTQRFSLFSAAEVVPVQEGPDLGGRVEGRRHLSAERELAHRVGTCKLCSGSSKVSINILFLMKLASVVLGSTPRPRQQEIPY